MIRRILALGDNQRDPQSRTAEHDLVMNFIAEKVEELRPDVVGHAGDWTERRPTHEDREFLFSWVRRIARVCGVVGVEGNHEEPLFCDEFAHLDVASPVDVATRPRVVVRGGIAFALCPWPRREQLHAWLGRPMAKGETDVLATALMQDVLRGLGASLDDVADPDMPRVLIIHAEPAQYRLGADQPMHVAQGMKVAVEDMVQLTRTDCVLAGHIHRPDTFVVPRGDGVDVPVLLIGSPRRTAYAKGELEEKGVVLVTFDGRTPTWERIPTPATPMQLVEATWGGTALVYATAPYIEKGAEVRLRYEVAADQRDAAKREAQRVEGEWLAAGAAEVKLDEVVLPVTAARAPQVAAAIGTQAKCVELWKARGEQVDDARRARLAAKLVQLEEEVSR